MDRLIIRGGKAVLKDRIEDGLALVCEDGFFDCISIDALIVSASFLINSS